MRMLLLLLLVPFCQYANAGPKVPSDCENLIDQVLSLAPEDYEMLEARGFKNAQSRFLYIGRGSEGLVLYDLNTATAVKFFKWPEDYENALAAYEILRSPSASSELKLVRLKSKNKKSLSIEMPYISDGIRFFDFYHSETYSATLKSKVISSFNRSLAEIYERINSTRETHGVLVELNNQDTIIHKLSIVTEDTLERIAQIGFNLDNILVRILPNDNFELILVDAY